MLPYKGTRGLLVTDFVFQIFGQVTRTTPELSPPFLTTKSYQREDNESRQRVFSDTRTRIRYTQATSS
ncbi:hypothetical protein TNCV_3598541 [Trichonephila clavipes]|nr:hypothetical protein TNCV_3598541 [Trichonephila clavipes]